MHKAGEQGQNRQKKTVDIETQNEKSSWFQRKMKSEAEQNSMA